MIRGMQTLAGMANILVTVSCARKTLALSHNTLAAAWRARAYSASSVAKLVWRKENALTTKELDDYTRAIVEPTVVFRICGRVGLVTDVSAGVLVCIPRSPRPVVKERRDSSVPMRVGVGGPDDRDTAVPPAMSEENAAGETDGRLMRVSWSR